jgi:hypothetical protein
LNRTVLPNLDVTPDGPEQKSVVSGPGPLIGAVVS